ncbi:polysaccharide pyruvyl transferase family protein [Cetobacterium sp. 2A]|uniref:polysaccharide pyruvyl transferase family protein n=1 Tax=Cetobacterium sp. 2A TaxID=2754723 RepID=UPI00163D3C0A|nr:polysaccharide pyruvyl transferase family protein [Cetobacterium sp. 2A]MBC2856171.1 polysaccharide pyruvyl transferase family protein [Cetobacterium sp. 2A]
MKKKVGILTYQWSSNQNFGAIIQCYAVQKMIEKEGYDSELVNYTPVQVGLKNKIFLFIFGKGFVEFSEKFLTKTKEYKTFEELKELNEKISTFIVGSDQVWRPIWWPSLVSRFFFDFVDDKNKKIAYAASFGVDRWEGDSELTEKIKKLVQRFNFISTREQSGIKVCKENFDVDAVCVLDPTMMLDKNDYQIILDDYKDKKHKEEKYIAHMLLDNTPKLTKISNEIAHYLKAKVNHIKGKEVIVFGKKKIKYNKVSQWLTYIKDSELIVTDSFHCTVFSIIFNKKFVVVSNSGRGISRLENLLSIMGLEDRFFTDIDQVIKSGILDEDIDYKEVEKKLEVHKNFSREFLKKALES